MIAMRRLLLGASALCVVLLLLAVLTVVALLPSGSEVREQLSSEHLLVESAAGEPIQEVRINRKRRVLRWVPLTEIPESAVGVVLSAEDRRFWWHPGVDPLALLSMVRDRVLSGKRLRGVSTVTMQLVKQLRPIPLLPRSGGLGKILQMVQALALELRWSKQEILEAYLNLLPLRGEVIGVEAGARVLLGKLPSALDQVDASLLAAWLQLPSRSSAQVAERSCQIFSGSEAPELCVVERNARITAKAVVAQPRGEAPHLGQFLRAKGVRGVYRSSIDLPLQRAVTELAREHISSLRAQRVSDAAVLVVDHRSGAVLSYVGGLGSQSSARFVDGVQSRRSAGSTLKPFLFGRLFEQRILAPHSLLDDAPLSIALGGVLYEPRNYDRQYRGEVSVAEALAGSLNTPAVRAAELLGGGELFRTLRRFGFQFTGDDRRYGLGMALGAPSVSLWELVRAYATLARGGEQLELHLGADEPRGNARQLLRSDAAWQLGAILSSQSLRGESFGLSSPLALPFWAAVKTGTSRDMTDNWCIGYSAHFTVGVWVGNLNGEPMRQVSGVTGAAPLWAAVMQAVVSRAGDPQSLQPPVAIAAAQRDLAELAQTNRSVARREWGRILYPVTGATIAIDPEIPREAQRIVVRSSIPFTRAAQAARLQILLDGTPLPTGSGANNSFVVPAPGRHRLQLVEQSSGALHDTVVFTVRGGR